MQKLALSMIVTATIVPYLSMGDAFGRFAILPGPAKYLPELLGGVALICVIALGVRNRFRFVPPAYWLAFGFLVLCLTAGAVANAIEPGPLFSGMRTYLRPIPWFFLPAVFEFTEKHVRTQLRLLAAICLLQVPVAIEQRITTADNYYGFVAGTGDWTTGTLVGSGDLSIFLVAAACVVAALTVRRCLSKWQGLLLFLLMLVPTMINETKVTLIVLPIAVVLTFQAAARRGERIKQAVIAIGTVSVSLALFVPTYDWLYESRSGASVGEFLFSNDLNRYLETGAEIGATREAGRLDSARVAVKETLQDPVRTAFGLGMGNATQSALGQQFSGKYAERYELFTKFSFANLVLELGLLSFSVLMIVYWFIAAERMRLAAVMTVTGRDRGPGRDRVPSANAGSRAHA
jgi:hypothetical protein